MSDKIIALVLIPVFTYYLTPSEFGIVSLSMVIVSFLSMIYNPGIISATLRLFYDSDSNGEKKVLIDSSFLMLIIPGIVVLVLSLIFGEPIIKLIFKDYNFFPYGLIAVSLAMLVQPIRLWSTVWVAYNKELYIAKSFIIRLIIASVISVILIALFKMGALGKLLGQLSGQILIMAVVIISILKLGKFKVSLTVMKKVFFLGFPLFFSVWGYIILDIGDRYLIERIMDMNSVGLYDVGYKIAAIPVVLSNGLNQVWTPIFYENLKNESYETIEKLLCYFIIFLTLICGTLILFTDEIFQLFINSRYYTVTDFVPYITAGVFFLGLSTVFSSALSYQKKFKTFTVVITISALINIILNLLLIPKLGLKGAALSTFCAFLLQNIIGYFLTKSFTRLYYSLRKVLLISSFILISFLTTLFFDHAQFSLTVIFAKLGIMSLWVTILFITGITNITEALQLSNYIKGKVLRKG